MEVLEKTYLKDIVYQSLNKSISYKDYRNLVEHLVYNNTTSGHEKTEGQISFTKLNDRRMKRWDKTIKVSNNHKMRISNIKNDTTWVVITESWCGDAAHILPAINKLAELNNNINLKIVFRDENEALMNQFLTNGSKSIPKLLAIDKTSKEIIDTYGPRPSIATQLVKDYKLEHGVITSEFKEDLQRWYNKDKGQNVIEDLIELFSN